MPDPATYRPAPGSIPVEPGVYRFRDPHGRVIYVGKAKSLRSRLNSYFADISGLAPRTRQMVMAAGSVEWTVVNTEVEALQLEYNWIKEFDPRFNVRYRDDKSYPVLAVTFNEEYPRLMVYRGARRKGVRYFGPYSHAWAIRETLDLLTRVFPEELMRVFRLYAVEYHCPYDEDKVKDLLRGLGRHEVESILAEQGEVVIRNEMCNHEYRFDARAIAELFH